MLRVAPGSNADATGLKSARISQDGEILRGDVIVSVNAEKVDSDGPLLPFYGRFRAGDTARLGVRRGGNSSRSRTARGGQLTAAGGTSLSACQIRERVLKARHNEVDAN